MNFSFTSTPEYLSQVYGYIEKFDFFRETQRGVSKNINQLKNKNCYLSFSLNDVRLEFFFPFHRWKISNSTGKNYFKKL